MKKRLDALEGWINYFIDDGLYDVVIEMRNGNKIVGSLYRGEIPEHSDCDLDDAGIIEVESTTLVNIDDISSITKVSNIQSN